MMVFDLLTYHSEDPCVLALGFFDCIHIGHQKVISRAVSLAQETGVKSAVFLFRNNIFSLIGSDKKPLFDFSERVSEIRKLGVDEVLYMEADGSFLSLSPQSFIEFLKGRINIAGVVCGEDYTYGIRGAGNARSLTEAFPKGKNEIIPLVEKNGIKIGSAEIKNMLAMGKVREAEEYLGRPFAISGTVCEGRKEGSKLGFPTLNLLLADKFLKAGVYYTETMLENKQYPSVTNIGSHPTFSDDTFNAETHLIGFTGNAYGKMITVRFLDFAREIKKFDSVFELREAIETDVKNRRAYDTLRTIGNR